MRKKFIFLMVSLNFLYISPAANATFEEDVQEIDQALSILRASGSYASALKDKDLDSPFLRHFESLVIKFIRNQPGAFQAGELDTTDRTQFAKESIFHEIYRDSAFFQTLEEMLSILKRKLMTHEEDTPPSFLSRAYQQILIEFANHLFKLQQSTIFDFIDHFGSSPEFKEKYGANMKFDKIYEAEGTQENVDCFLRTPFCKFVEAMNCSVKIENLQDYFDEHLPDFVALIEDVLTCPQFTSFNFSQSLAGEYTLQFFDLLEPYKLLQKKSQKSSPYCSFVPLYDQYIKISNLMREQSNEAQTTYEKQCKRSKDPSDHAVYLTERNQRFQAYREEFTSRIDRMSLEHLRNFRELIQKDQEADQRRKKKQRHHLKKPQSAISLGAAAAKESEDDRSAAPKKEEGRAVERESEESLAVSDVAPSETKTVLESEVKKEEGLDFVETAEDSEEFSSEESEETSFEMWWKAFQTPKKKRSKTAYEGSAGQASAQKASVPEAFQCALSANAFEFFSVMGGHAPWNPNLTKLHLKAFQSEIVRHYESYLKKEAFSGSVTPKLNSLSRPMFILPNLKKEEGSSDLPYLIFRLPHLPHGRSKNFYPELKDFYEKYFKEAGLSLENVKRR